MKKYLFLFLILLFSLSFLTASNTQSNPPGKDVTMQTDVSWLPVFSQPMTNVAEYKSPPVQTKPRPVISIVENSVENLINYNIEAQGGNTLYTPPGYQYVAAFVPLASKSYTVNERPLLN